MASSNSPEMLDELIERHAGVGLDVAGSEDQITLRAIRVPRDAEQQGPALDALNDVLAHADREGLVVAVTPRGGKRRDATVRGLRSLYADLGFVRTKDGRHSAVTEEWVRSPVRLEQSARPPERGGALRAGGGLDMHQEAPVREGDGALVGHPLPDRGSQTDALEPYSRWLPGRDAARIGTLALGAIPDVARQPSESLRTRSAELGQQLGSGPTLAQAVKRWMTKEGERAAWAEALDASTARGEARSALDRHRALLGQANVTEIETRAAAILADLEHWRPGEVQQQMERLEKGGDPYATLDQSRQSWIRDRARVAAEKVATDRELQHRDALTAIRAAVRDAEARPVDIPAGENPPLGLDAIDAVWKRLGEERATLLLKSALAHSEQLEREHPAVLETYQERLGDPFKDLPRNEAYETQRLQQAWRDTTDELKQIEAKAGQIRDAGGEHVEHKLESLRGEWTTASQKLGEIERRGQELWDEGTHLDAWLMKNGHSAALKLAVSEQLLARHPELANQREHRAASEQNVDLDLGAEPEALAVDFAGA